MTFTTVDKDDVRYRSGKRGEIEASFANNIPDIAVTATTGGGAVDTNVVGAGVNAGDTSGDTAAIEGQGYLDPDAIDLMYRWVGYRSGQGNPTNTFYLGGRRSLGQAEGTWWNLTDSTYNVDGTSAASKSPGNNADGLLQIKIDRINQETTFTRYSGAITPDVVTISSTPSNRYIGEVLAASESNGAAGEEISVANVSDLIVQWSGEEV